MGKNYRILQVISTLGSGGAERIVIETTNRFIEDYGYQADILILEDINVYREQINNKSKLFISPHGLKSIKNIAFIENIIREQKYDLVHFHLSQPLYYGAFLSKKTKDLPVVFLYTEHSTHNRRRDVFIFKYIEKYIYSKYDLLLAISEKTKEKLYDWIGIDGENIKTLENASDYNKFNKATPLPIEDINDNFSKDTKLVTMVSRFSPAKDHETVIRAMSKIEKSDIHLLFLGSGDNKRSKKLARDLGLEDRIHFLGYKSNPENYMKVSDLIVQSSYWEGFGLVAVEAMSTGVPFIYSRVDGMKDILYQEEMSFDQGDKDRLAYLIEDITTNRKKYDYLVDQQSKKAKEYDYKEYMEKLVQIYNKEISKKRTT